MKNLFGICLFVFFLQLTLAAQTYHYRITTVRMEDFTEIKKIDSIVRKSRFKGAKYIDLSFFNATDVRLRNFYAPIDTDTTYYIAIFGKMAPLCDSGDCITKYREKYYILPVNVPWDKKYPTKKNYYYRYEDILTKYFTMLPMLIERNSDGRMTEVSDTTERYYFLTE